MRGGVWPQARAVLVAWAVLGALTFFPWWVAWTYPPRDLAFVGFFYYVDDQYNYLSFAQQAEDGAFLFGNKLVSAPHTGSLVNLEWWLVGRLSALLGSQPTLAYRIFGLGAALGLLAGIDRWLRRAGLPGTHRLPALLLVATGGGLGWALTTFASRPLGRCLDLYAGLYPFLGLFVNAHFVAGTALLLWALDAFARVSGRGGVLRAFLLGTVLGLVRPYDLVLLVAIRGLAVLGLEPRRRWLRSLAPLLTLLPAGALNYVTFYRDPAFSFYPRALYAFPPLGDFGWALGPPTVLAVSLWRRGRDEGERETRIHLAVWASMAFAMIVASPLPFSLQFLVGVGTPLLAAAALGLARFPRPAMLAGLVACGGSFVAVLSLLLLPSPAWFVPAERLQIARALRPHCRPGDVLLAPPDIGLYAGGLTACRPWVSHPIGPAFAERREAVLGFYQTWSPAERAAFLDREGIAHVVLPGSQWVRSEPLLGSGTPFRLAVQVGEGPRSLAVHTRSRARLISGAEHP